MHEVKLPQMGQSVEEASIVQWLKKEGDRVQRGDPLVSIQTDKAEIECESPASGVLRKILLEPDVSVPVMTVIALVGEADEPLPDLAQYRSGASVAEAPQESAPTPAVAPVVAETPVTSDRVSVSPRARKKAEALHVDPSLAKGTGAGGRIMEEDVIAYAASVGSVKATPTARRLAEVEGVDLARVHGSGPGGKVMKEDVAAAAGSARPSAPSVAAAGKVPLSPMRRIIAQRMCDSKFSAPHYYVTVEVDMAAAAKFRASAPVKPSYNDIVMRATALALSEFPLVNARWCGDAIEVVSGVHLGFAVALPAGLIVPVVRDVQNLSLQGISQACRDLTEKARNGKLMPDDYTGSSFTISNLGGFGVDQFTAIINQPDSAILAVGQIKDRPVVVDGGIHIRPIMKLTLSSDHRVIDGALAAQFMGRLKQILEEARL
ncbi:MAG: 2-oxo acid dehydrogenase subunit E2 [Candidatus Hydrogenedentes bacterium]|nr:2-oxo acid dehydrogenase subunit E2 [Candidatus Hydrogenedentota bacterium]